MQSNDSIKVRKIGKYILQRQIGQGSMGTVWLSHHMGLDVSVAVKLLKSSLVEEDPEYVERFIQEGNLAATVNHKNVVRIYDAGHQGKTYYMVMEYVDGGNILELISEVGRLNSEDVIDYALVLADALAEAHNLGVIHRDIKPENIMLTKDGKVKLADLGLAKHVDNEYSSTITGVAIGTPNYMSPEQTRNAKAADLRTDIYSLGASLYHMLTGEVPFKGDSSIDIMMKHCTEELIPPNKVCENIPERLSQIICKMMEKLPEDRFASCEELLREFNNLKYKNEEKSRSISKTQINLKGISLEDLKERQQKNQRKHATKNSSKYRSFIILAIAMIILVPSIILLGQTADETQSELERKLINNTKINSVGIDQKSESKINDQSIIQDKEEQGEAIVSKASSIKPSGHVNKIPELKFINDHPNEFTFMSEKKLKIHKDLPNRSIYLPTKNKYTDYRFFVQYKWLEKKSSFKFVIARYNQGNVSVLLNNKSNNIYSGSIVFKNFKYDNFIGNFRENLKAPEDSILISKSNYEKAFGENNLLMVHRKGNTVRVVLNKQLIGSITIPLEKCQVGISLWSACDAEISKFAFDTAD
ncbi:MAG: serine/threonine protein kinase [Lentisphaeraceae bacterium]|nr:serine/threonine protein kinase [Lentisphaeraceae bacterium]